MRIVTCRRLFIMVGGLVQTGVIATVSEAAGHAAEGRTGLAAMLLLWAGRAVGDRGQHPVRRRHEPGRRRPGGPGGNVLWWARALGADLGGNATAVGASANVVALASSNATATRSASGNSPATACRSP